MGNKIMSNRGFVDEKFTRPQGVYDPKDGEYRKLRRLILNGELAPCFPGTEECTSELDECPICFLFYPSLNRSRCCSKAICTECYVQIKSARFTRSTPCPFCKTSSYTVEFRGAKTVEEKGSEQAEEQKVIEAKIRMRQKELHDEAERVQRLGADTQAEPFEHDTNYMSMEPGVSAQAVQVQESIHWLNKNDGFDVDIEDMMLMEKALWLSIQEQGQRQHDFARAEQVPAMSALSENGCLGSNQSSTKRAGRAGGVTRVTAALAGRQATCSENRGADRSANSSQTLNVNHSVMQSGDLATRSCTIDPSGWGLGAANRASHKEKQDVPWEAWQNVEQSRQTTSWDSEDLNGWLTVSEENPSWYPVESEGRRSTLDLGVDQSSSEAVEAGASFSSSIPSASALPSWEAREFHSSRSSVNVGETSLSAASALNLLVSFEDQIMLAMALSLADAQAEARRQE